MSETSKCVPGKLPRAVALLGGGVIGGGWAARFIINGVNVRLYDHAPAAVERVQKSLWLGHAQVATTHRYAAVDVEMMRRGLEKAGVSGDRSARFRPNDTILQLLASI
ncbi:3-hydroxyacyl-CoA dehydrogenase NAD-binding domain-containing protein [Bradyrhizobium yuanmingense]|uniref:3-hydroxyacyl-CoA dehydrogenase NAD-binding domain-containing protein n=1 Tax=Bradyrhizobium yuanmingense TaxID=108015 RepID=UPI0023B8A936|nr:3-hydroxyacyl-CoA dehydrogenase NAD-binding domain-containing protein [Bradyrhizobium yuanmingense]MDF0523389.1 3-hydroxyacyl-CoA dehydrogenase NAD-binding domain-containing protein [Bradyrhizobium yuanmingense]